MDSNFYNKINKLNLSNHIDIHNHISNSGIQSGLIYHPIQLKNIFPDIRIYTQ